MYRKWRNEGRDELALLLFSSSLVGDLLLLDAGSAVATSLVFLLLREVVALLDAATGRTGSVRRLRLGAPITNVAPPSSLELEQDVLQRRTLASAMKVERLPSFGREPHLQLHNHSTGPLDGAIPTKLLAKEPNPQDSVLLSMKLTTNERSLYIVVTNERSYVGWDLKLKYPTRYITFIYS
jgi:hypothetical protein